MIFCGDTSTISDSVFKICFETRYKQNVVKHDDINNVISPLETEWLQYVGDNTDHDIATVDGKNTHHGLGAIAIANGKFSNTRIHRTALPRDKKQTWTEITSNKGIEVKQYDPTGIPVLKTTIMEPVIQELLQYQYMDILWNCAYIFNKPTPSWSGYMSSVVKAGPQTKSIVTMLPIINLSATDLNALYSLLTFVTEQSSKHNLPMPAITFDQPLYIKAYEIASSMNMKIFVRLGGFHQLMSYLGSIGHSMEGSGLRNALETVCI